MKLHLIWILLFVTACAEPDKSKLLSGDYQLFQATPAWELAKAVEQNDISKVKGEVDKNKDLVRFQESRFGQSLLMIAVINTKYESAKMLLELGANPNLQDMSGNSALMEAARIGGLHGSRDPRFLKLLLAFGGKPNEQQHGTGKTKYTPLMFACENGNLDNVKILVNKGAKVNAVNEYGDSPLSAAAIQGHPDVVMFLLENGVNPKQVLYKTIPEGESKYLTDAMRHWRFDIGSAEYKRKMQIADLLKKSGMDYRKTKIPDEFLGSYTKDYLSKY